jgi:simple sugar transport system ATP-binding protein
VLVLGQPTRGVDVGGIEFLHARIRAARDAGNAVLLVSADLTEILALSDRIGVLYAGRLRGPIPARDATPERLGLLMTGAEDAA